MSAITLHLPDDLVSRLRSHEDRLPEILELGLRDLSAQSQSGFDDASQVFEFLATLPPPEQVLALRPSPALAERISFLLSQSREQGLSPSERAEWSRYEYLEHLVRLAKANAHRLLSQTTPSARD